MSSQPHSITHEIDAALSYWAALGVDCSFHDDARAWLAERPAPDQPDGLKSSATASVSHAHPASTRQMSPGAKNDLDEAKPKSLWGDSPPQSLSEFHRWWMECPTLGERSLYPRIAPRGGSGAKLMVIIPDPEAEDQSQLLSGPQGKLLAQILSAMGLRENEYYLASALPCHTPRADLSAMAQGGLGVVLAHHIALAMPQRVVMFGQGLKTFLNTNAENTNDALREINHRQVSTQLFVTETLGSMLDMPRLKARFWRRWMEWSA